MEEVEAPLTKLGMSLDESSGLSFLKMGQLDLVSASVASGWIMGPCGLSDCVFFKLEDYFLFFFVMPNGEF